MLSRTEAVVLGLLPWSCTNPPDWGGLTRVPADHFRDFRQLGILRSKRPFRQSGLPDVSRYVFNG